ncbi:hypothetical protein EVAR_69105_1 [Eumeta japonica]|uniref:Uncharacterized protein n=1 Tax=Eumeta variegata TaxID=151549 RepID=A0A4C1SK14_EUMVA|nr:hypothetical protein EVAR_69105_1 [Eumeta japonica]
MTERDKSRYTEGSVNIGGSVEATVREVLSKVLCNVCLCTTNCCRFFVRNSLGGRERERSYKHPHKQRIPNGCIRLQRKPFGNIATAVTRTTPPGVKLVNGNYIVVEISVWRISGSDSCRRQSLYLSSKNSVDLRAE